MPVERIEQCHVVGTAPLHPQRLGQAHGLGKTVEVPLERTVVACHERFVGPARHAAPVAQKRPAGTVVERINVQLVRTACALWLQQRIGVLAAWPSGNVDKGVFSEPPRKTVFTRVASVESIKKGAKNTHRVPQAALRHALGGAALGAVPIVLGHFSERRAAAKKVE